MTNPQKTDPAQPPLHAGRHTRRIQVIVPCYNEESGIEMFYRCLRQATACIPAVQWEYILVDDGSSDRTLSVLNRLAETDAKMQVLSLSRNFGHQVALTAGLDVADADAVILMDADLQHPPGTISRFVDVWCKEDHDIVSGVRSQTEDASLFKKVSARCFYALINTISDTEIVPGAADFCLLSRRAYEALRSMPERHRFLRGMISWIGFKRGYVEFVAPRRQAGISKYTTAKMFKFALDAVFSFSIRPIRLVVRTGIGTVVCALVYLVYVGVRYFIIGDLIPGWASTIAIVAVLGGGQLCAIGVIGEYIARLYEQSKNRPLYFFAQPPLSFYMNRQEDGLSGAVQRNAPELSDKGEQYGSE